MRFSRALRNFLLGYFIVHLLVAAVFLFVVTAWLKDQMFSQTRHRMQDVCTSVRDHIRQLPQGMQQPELLEYLKRLEAETDSRFTLISETGKVIVDSRTGNKDIGDHGDRPEIVEARSEGVGFHQRTSATLQLPLLYLAMPVKSFAGTEKKNDNGFVRIAVEEKSVLGTIGSLQKFLWIFTIASALFAGLLMVIFASREMRPLKNFADAAKSIASGQYAMLPGISNRDDEWKSLSDAFSVMQSELKQRESRLMENSMRIEAVLGSMVEGVLAVDSRNSVLVANEAACQLLGVSQKDVVASKLPDMVRIPELSRVVNHTLLTHSSIQTEFDMAGSPRRRLEVRVAPMSDEREFGAAIVIHDVTDLRALETMRRDFVANVSHELKTPLASIQAYAETLRLGALNDEKNNLNFVQQIEGQAKVLEDQIADLLKISELESGKTTFEVSSIDMNEVFKKCQDRFRVETKRQGLEIRIDMQSESCLCYTDRIGLRTILDNLVSNAIRYARPSGFVRLTANEGQTSTTFSVTDNGMGISPEHQERIFERFYRVDSARSRDLGGTGLGLAIVKHTVNALGGQIELESKTGQGSTFTVVLPKPKTINEPIHD